MDLCGQDGGFWGGGVGRWVGGVFETLREEEKEGREGCGMGWVMGWAMGWDGMGWD